LFAKFGDKHVQRFISRTLTATSTSAHEPLDYYNLIIKVNNERSSSADRSLNCVDIAVLIANFRQCIALKLLQAKKKRRHCADITQTWRQQPAPRETI